MKKFAVLLFLFVYFFANFVNFAGLSVCIAKDHIGLNLFGIEKSCIEVLHNNHETINTVQHSHDDCEDKSLSTNTSELMPNVDNLSIFADLYNSVLSNFFEILPKILDNKNFKPFLLFYNHLPDNTVLSAYKTIRLLI